MPQGIRTVPAPTPEEIRTEGHSAGTHSARALGNFAARQRPARFRTRRRKKRRNRQSRSRGRIRTPDDKLGERGFGTVLRTDPVFLGLQKTRLLDPMLSLPGTNDHPGDYRGSGCTACHVIYANDRSPAHSGPYARFGTWERALLPIRPSRRMNPAIQSATVSREPFPPANA